jgi:hypothetical protein
MFASPENTIQNPVNSSSELLQGYGDYAGFRVLLRMVEKSSVF